MKLMHVTRVISCPRRVLLPDSGSEAFVHWCNLDQRLDQHGTAYLSGSFRSTGFPSEASLGLPRTLQIRRSALRRIHAQNMGSLSKWRTLATKARARGWMVFEWLFGGATHALPLLRCNSGRCASTLQMIKTGSLSSKTGRKPSQATKKQSKAGWLVGDQLWCAWFYQSVTGCDSRKHHVPRSRVAFGDGVWGCFASE